jgi:Raf kinase inhibitor-like YbhB/YbcL family protein
MSGNAEAPHWINIWEERMNTLLKSTIAISLFSLLAISANAQGNQGGPPVLAKDLAPARFGTTLRVTSSAFSSGGMIDGRYTQNGENVSPSLDWAKPPAGTRTLAVIVADAGVNRPEPIVQWIVYNIPSTMRHLSSQVVGDSSLPNGVMQGKNVSGKPGYIGPKPPAGQTHPYYFQVFALDRTLDIDPASADRTTLINAMKGHVLASGSVVGRYTGQ